MKKGVIYYINRGSEKFLAIHLCSYLENKSTFDCTQIKFGDCETFCLMEHIFYADFMREALSLS